MKIINLLITLMFAFGLQASELKPFKSDGCSAFPDGTLGDKNLWLSCCYQHDLAYWQGGNSNQRKQADIALKNCVQQVGEPTIAKLMLAGVRVGGTPYLPTPYRWAYGWPYLRGYKELSAAEQNLVDQALDEFNAANNSSE